MTVVTGGIVRYERSVKVADYENKKLGVELSFNVDDGADEAAVLDQVGNQAVEFVHNKLGIPAGTPARRTPAARATGSAGGPITETASGDAQKQASAAGRKPAAKPPAKTPAPADDVVDMGETTTGQAISTGGERTDPAADDLSFLDDTPAAVETITDQQVVDKIGVVNAKIKNPIAIKKLLSEFVGAPPKSYRDLTQAQRPEFIKKLEAL